MMPPPEKPPPKSRGADERTGQKAAQQAAHTAEEALALGLLGLGRLLALLRGLALHGAGGLGRLGHGGTAAEGRPPPRRAASAVSGRAYIQAPPSMMSMVRMALIFMGVSVRVKDARVLLFSIACTIAGLVKKARGAGLSRRDGRAFPR